MPALYFRYLIIVKRVVIKLQAVITYVLDSYHACCGKERLIWLFMDVY